jgi:hypothetical protein
MENAVVLDSADPSEAQRRLRARARATARLFSWDRVLDQLTARVQVLAASRAGSAARSPRRSYAAGASSW